MAAPLDDETGDVAVGHTVTDDHELAVGRDDQVTPHFADQRIVGTGERLAVSRRKKVDRQLNDR